MGPQVKIEQERFQARMKLETARRNKERRELGETDQNKQEEAHDFTRPDEQRIFDIARQAEQLQRETARIEQERQIREAEKARTTGVQEHQYEQEAREDYMTRMAAAWGFGEGGKKEQSDENALTEKKMSSNNNHDLDQGKKVFRKIESKPSLRLDELVNISQPYNSMHKPSIKLDEQSFKSEHEKKVFRKIESKPSIRLDELANSSQPYNSMRKKVSSNNNHDLDQEKKMFRKIESKPSLRLDELINSSQPYNSMHKPSIKLDGQSFKSKHARKNDPYFSRVTQERRMEEDKKQEQKRLKREEELARAAKFAEQQEQEHPQDSVNPQEQVRLENERVVEASKQQEQVHLEKQQELSRAAEAANDQEQEQLLKEQELARVAEVAKQQEQMRLEMEREIAIAEEMAKQQEQQRLQKEKELLRIAENKKAQEEYIARMTEARRLSKDKVEAKKKPTLDRVKIVIRKQDQQKPSVRLNELLEGQEFNLTQGDTEASKANDDYFFRVAEARRLEEEKNLEQQRLEREHELARAAEMTKRQEQERLLKEQELARAAEAAWKQEQERLLKEKELAQIIEATKKQEQLRLENEKELARVAEMAKQQEQQRLEREKELDRAAEAAKQQKQKRLEREMELLRITENAKKQEEERLLKEQELVRVAEEAQKRVQQRLEREQELLRIAEQTQGEMRKQEEDQKLKEEYLVRVAEAARLAIERKQEEERIKHEAHLTRSEEKRKMDDERRAKEAKQMQLERERRQEEKRKVKEEYMKLVKEAARREEEQRQQALVAEEREAEQRKVEAMVRAKEEEAATEERRKIQDEYLARLAEARRVEEDKMRELEQSKTKSELEFAQAMASSPTDNAGDEDALEAKEDALKAKNDYLARLAEAQELTAKIEQERKMKEAELAAAYAEASAELQRLNLAREQAHAAHVDRLERQHETSVADLQAQATDVNFTEQEDGASAQGAFDRIEGEYRSGKEAFLARRVAEMEAAEQQRNKQEAEVLSALDAMKKEGERVLEVTNATWDETGPVTIGHESETSSKVFNLPQTSQEQLSPSVSDLQPSEKDKHLRSTIENDIDKDYKAFGQRLSEMMSNAIENTLTNEKAKFINAKNTVNDTKRRAQQRLIRGISEKERAAENIAELQAQMEMQSKQVSKRLEEVLADVQMKIEKEMHHMIELFREAIRGERNRQNVLSNLTDLLDKAIVSTELEISTEEIITADMKKLMGSLEGKYYTNMDNLVKIRDRAASIDKALLADLHDCVHELHLVLGESRERQKSLEITIDELTQPEMITNDQRAWALTIDAMAQELGDAAISVENAEKNIRSLKARIEEAFSSKLVVLGEPIPELFQREALSQKSDQQETPPPDINSPRPISTETEKDQNNCRSAINAAISLGMKGAESIGNKFRRENDL
eukprot:CAMPEP_0196807916 /NCGR_PEP_ID=MMETSP1362-20130617/7883_1 /TAXON_ID=163516 /ORGANISM="Leptocylindrus danicus, Strain CCMP1856" /LENGTH=1410 /DNA_ID=CAMNT_0042182025 /DNA_START=325 /DNA_END=4557 /DNA_ORIENTATION=-